MKNNSTLIKRFHCEMTDFIKKYQFRDRNEMSSCGMSISQCYILEALNRFGPLTMQQLADKMHLSISTMTRAIDPLVNQKLIRRESDYRDQRVRIVQLTKNGTEKFLISWKSIMESEKVVLESFPQEQREMLVVFLQKLNNAFGSWNSCSCKVK